MDSATKNKTEFIDLTILNTPKPQACSTVERKPIMRKSTKGFLDKLDKIPTRDIDNEVIDDRSISPASSHSSLGILFVDNVESFTLDSNVKPKNNVQECLSSNSITANLLKQRQLALEVIEKADRRNKRNIGILPSYLLKPSDTPQRNNMSSFAKNNESTIEASDLELMAGNFEDINDEKANEISARSSSLGASVNEIKAARSPPARNKSRTSINSYADGRYPKSTTRSESTHYRSPVRNEYDPTWSHQRYSPPDENKYPRSVSLLKEAYREKSGHQSIKSRHSRGSTYLQMNEGQKRTSLQPQTSFKSKELSSRSPSLGGSRLSNKPRPKTREEFGALDDDELDAELELLMEEHRKAKIEQEKERFKERQRQQRKERQATLKSDELKQKRLSKEFTTISSLSTSDISCTDQDSLLQDLQNELFSPAELAADRLLEDELAWVMNNKNIPKKNDNHMEFSTLSGYMGDSNRSFQTSKMSEKASNISDFFKRKTEDVRKLNLKSSPKKKSAPVPLMSETTISDIESDTADHEKEEPRMSTGSVLSVSQIAEFLANLNPSDTPRKAVDLLLAAKSKINKNEESITYDDKSLFINQTENGEEIIREVIKMNEVKQLENSDDIRNETTSKLQQSELSSISSTFKNTLTPINNTTKVISDTSNSIFEQKENESKERKIKLKNSRPALKDSSNLPNGNDVETAEKKNITMENDNKYNVEEDEDEWTDVKLYGKGKTSEKTPGSSFAESPSISCSELEFSEDEPDNSGMEYQVITDEWVRITPDLEPHKACVRVAYEAEVNMYSLTNRWLLYKMFLNKVKLEGELQENSEQVVRVKLPKKEELIKYGAEINIPVQFVTYSLGKVELVLIVELTDMVTKNQKMIEHTLTVESEQAEISTSLETLDFEVLPEESEKRIIVSVINNSRVELPLNLAISQELDVFCFGSECEEENSSSELQTTSKIILTANGSVPVLIDMQAPTLYQLNCQSHVTEIKAKLIIYLETETTTVLREVPIVGRVGMTKIQFRSSCVPLILLPGQMKPLQMKNSGVVTMELSAVVVDSVTREPDNMFSLDVNDISLKPNQSGSINVTFNPVSKIPANTSVHKMLRLCHLGGPTFVCTLEGLTNEKSPKLKSATSSPKLKSAASSPKLKSATLSPRSSPRATSSPSESRSSGSNSNRPASVESLGTLTHLSSGKLPIESTRFEIVWNCVKLGKTDIQNFVIRNKSLQRVRFQISIVGNSCFKLLLKDQNESVSTVSLALHGMESRTINVTFNPVAKCAAAAKIMFVPFDPDVIQSKRQLIFLYGYGGHASVDVQKIGKDSSGKMWLSLGKLNRQSPLENSFILRNNGTLPAFAFLRLCPKGLFPCMDANIKITPMEIIIAPSKEIEVFVKFTPRAEDFKFIHSSPGASGVTEIASVQIVCGAEPTRGRIRRLYANQSLSPAITNDSLLPKLTAPFINEYMPVDLSSLKERASMKELLHGLVTRDITLTIEQDLEQTTWDAANGVDDTAMFQSLCNEVSQLTLDHSSLERELRRSSGGFCTVEPMKIILTPPIKMQDTVLLSCKHSRPMPFEIMLPSGELQVSPTIGVVSPGDTTVITVSCSPTQTKQLQFFKVKVYMENDMVEVEVKVVRVQSRRSNSGLPRK